MWKPKSKGQILAILAILALVISLAGASTVIYWSHTVSKQITIIGIDALVCANNYDAYRLKTPLTVLGDDNQIVLAIISENYYTIWLNITYSGCPGLVMSATAQFVTVQWVGPTTGSITPYGSSFNTMGYTTYDAATKPNLMWADPGTGVGGSIGHGMLITFGFNIEGCLTPGTYTVNVLLQMGFA